MMLKEVPGKYPLSIISADKHEAQPLVCFSFHLSIEKQHETTGGSPSSLLPVNQRQNSAVVSRFAFTPVLRNQNCACLAKGDLKEKQNRFNGFKTMKCSVTAADSPSVKLLRLSAAYFGSSVTRPLHGLPHNRKT